MSSTLLVDSQWRIKDALDLIRTLQPHVKPFGFHICLGGGVLNSGHSKKDLDLYFLSLDQGKTDADKLLAFLTETWGPSQPMQAVKNRIEQYTNARGVAQFRLVPADPPPPYPTPADSPYSHKLKFTWSGLRIDVFVLGGKAPLAQPASPAEPSASVEMAQEVGPPGFVEEMAGGLPETLGEHGQIEPLSFAERLARSAEMERHRLRQARVPVLNDLPSWFTPAESAQQSEIWADRAAQIREMNAAERLDNLFSETPPDTAERG